MICPGCGNDITPQHADIAPPLALCPICFRSLVLSDDHENARLARSLDTVTLDNAKADALRSARTALKKAANA